MKIETAESEWFIASVFAVRSTETGTTFHHSARVFSARSQREAEGIALHDLREDKKESMGWGTYDVAVAPFDRYAPLGSGSPAGVEIEPRADTPAAGDKLPIPESRTGE